MASKIAYPWFYFYRISRLSLLVFLPTLFFLLILYRASHKEGLVSQVTQLTEENLRTTQFTLERSKLDWKDWCEALPRLENARYTLASKDGRVVCDTLKTKEDSKVQDMHEINMSFDKGFASEVRYSDVFETEAVFASLKLTPELAIRKVVPITALKNDMGRFDRILFFRIVPFAFLSYFLFIYLFYRATKPLGSVLAKVQKFKSEISFDKTLQFLYKQDEWAHIEEALHKADKRLQDQVEQAKTENEKIGAILESIYDDIIAVDAFETVLFYNSNFKRNFMNDRSEGDITPKLWHTFKDENILKAFRSVLKSGETASLKALNFQSFHQPDRYFDLTITPLKGANGKVSGVLGVFYDVTEFKLTEQMRVDFVANVSHEIRTPLTSIKGYTQILQSQASKIDPELHLFLEKIISNTERMISLFNDLLNLSVIESQNLIRPELFSLPSIVEFITESIKTNYPKKKIDVITDFKLETIKGDPRLIEQVLSNLIDNACRYSGPGDLTIKIESKAVASKALISVSDNGPGIAKEYLQRIFERFYRIESSREISRGTGLGLSIVKHIIAKHGGRIWAESDGMGTVFTIELPLEDVL